MSETIAVSPIRALSELLVETGICLTQREAASKIKTGKVRVGSEYLSVRVANKEALLVIVGPTVISCEGKHAVTIEPIRYSSAHHHEFGRGSTESSEVAQA